MKALLLAALLAAVLAACGGEPGEPVLVTVPRGSGSGAVVDSLAAHDLVNNPLLFRLYLRLRGADRSLKPGTYRMAPGMSWRAVADKLVSGEVATVQVVVPEGWSTHRIAPQIAAVTGADPDRVLGFVQDSAAAAQLGVPGPTLEGYLYPATYTFPMNADFRDMVGRMVNRYRQVWSAQWRARADSLGMSEREVVTLASIVEMEAKVWSERDTIAGVYLNRLEIGMPLQADPTVQYALGEHQQRLLYRHIDTVADHPYNTYTRRGLPPGPIASPSQEAMRAVLYPAGTDYLYFVARPDGRHVFSETLREHNRARARIRAALREAGAARSQ
ncbi:MAG: endolytic transglycosylase MltG [Longimicrobiaceae bacterium]